MTQFTLSLLTIIVLFFSAVPLHSAVKAPMEIGGFKLGTSIDDYEFISYRNFLKQVVIEDLGPFRKGVIEYGVCDRPGRIVKIKLKYEDYSEDFYATLLKKYRQKLGEPDQYTGDAFGILKAWKWHFTNEQGEKVSLTLQYNRKNLDESLGSVVKLSLPERVEAERKCFNRVCEGREKPPVTLKEKDWESMIPK